MMMLLGVNYFCYNPISTRVFVLFYNFPFIFLFSCLDLDILMNLKAYLAHNGIEINWLEFMSNRILMFSNNSDSHSLRPFFAFLRS